MSCFEFLIRVDQQGKQVLVSKRYFKMYIKIVFTYNSNINE